MTARSLCLGLGLLLLSTATWAQERALRFGVSDSWAMPLAQLENGQATDGIVYDLYHRLATLVGRDAEILVLPRQRIFEALERGSLDAHCYTNPRWLAEAPPGYVWSTPFTVQNEVLVSRQGQHAPLDELNGERVATVLGFVYPALEPYFKRGALVRVDARTQEQVLRMVAARRVDYGISSELALNWYNRGQPGEQLLQAVNETSSQLVSCVVRDAEGVPTLELLRAMLRVKRDGTFEAILKRYR